MLTNYKIKRIMKHTKFPTSGEYEEKMDMLIEQIKKEQNVQYSYRKKKRVTVAVSIACACIILSITAKASIDYLQEKMQKLPEDEKEEIYEELQNARGEEEIIYSRELTQKEEERYHDLFSQYENSDILPKTELRRTDGYSEQESEILVYDWKSRTLHLPERELSDEELLEIIDYYHKADYTLQQKSQAISQTENEIETIPSSDTLGKEVVEKGKKYINFLFQTDLSDAEIEIEYSSEFDFYDVQYTTDYNEQYFVSLDAGGLDLIDFSYYKDGEDSPDYYEKSAVYDRDVILKKYEEAKEKFAVIADFDKEVVKTTCEYRLAEDGVLPSGNVQYFFVLKDGNAYSFRYNFERDIFWNVYRMSEYEMFEKAEASKEQDRNKRGEKRCVELMEER